jgi:hypothetical protein
MRGYFTRERFGRPQFLAGLLLLVFLGQAMWLVRQSSGNTHVYVYDVIRLQSGSEQLRHGSIAGTASQSSKGNFQSEGAAASDAAEAQPEANDGYDAEHSPLWYLVQSAPVAAWASPPGPETGGYFLWYWLMHAPFLACGVLLGASLWYVARRLCGNAGGFVALTFYCFSPAMIKGAALWHTEPEIVTVWGAFGAIFTAIAVAHTLYAPREVVLWNWRRIVLLGISLALAVGCQFSMIVLLPMTLVFLLYVAPVRRGAGVVIWLAACGVGFILLFAAYFFRAGIFLASMRHAMFWGATWRGFTVAGVYKEVALQILQACPALVITLPVAVVTYLIWRRTRYFGNTAPLLVALVFVGLGMAHPHEGGAGFLAAAVPFIFLFVSGVLADLMETQQRALVTACVIGLLAAYTVWSFLNLVRVPRG